MLLDSRCCATEEDSDGGQMATITSVQTGAWQDTNTWDSGTIPGVGDRVIIDAGHVVTADGNVEFGTGARSTTNDETNASLVIRGTLKFSRTTSSTFKLHGQVYISAGTGYESTWDMGTEGDPIPAGVTHEVYLNADGSALQGANYASIYSAYLDSNRYSKFYTKSAVERKRNTWLTAAVDAGATEITVADATGWQAGDQLLIAPRWTDPHNSYANREWELATIQSVNGNSITLTAGLSNAHGWDEDYNKIAAGVANLTSNIRFVGASDQIMYQIWLRRADVNIQDLEIAYANNVYAYYTAPLRIWTGRFYGPLVLKRIAIWASSSGVDDNIESLLYLQNTSYAHPQDISDITLASVENATGRRLVRGVNAYYGGQNTIINELCVYAGLTQYVTTGVADYQQPVTWNNCRMYGAYMGLQLHDNVDTDTNGCLVAGAYRATNTYNGTAIHRDLKVRWANYLALFNSGWRGRVTIERPDYHDGHLNNTGIDAVEYNTPLPDGNLTRIIDVNANPNDQWWYYTGGQKWWDSTNTRTDPHSIAMRSTSDEYSVPHEREFEATAGDALLVGVYVRNLSATYVGSLTMRLKQGSDLLAEQTWDLTALTIGQWSLLSLSGTAVRTAAVTWEMEYVGNGGEIALTDFQQPFTADQKAQAAAVWAALTADNHAAGSFGEYLGQLLEPNIRGADNDDLKTISDQLDTVQADLDNPDQYKADVSNLALEYTAQSIKSKTDNLPSDPASESSVQDAKTAAEEARDSSEQAKDLFSGRWLRVGTQLIIYGPDNTTELARFELYRNGTPVAGPEDIATERRRL